MKKNKISAECGRGLFALLETFPDATQEQVYRFASILNDIADAHNEDYMEDFVAVRFWRGNS